MNWKEISQGYHLFRDGNAWCAVGPHFQDLHQSLAGFGDDPAGAVDNLRSAIVNAEPTRRHPLPVLKDFTVHNPQS